MSQENVAAFLNLLLNDSELREKFKTRNLAELLFHAENIGQRFTFEQLSQVIAAMEIKIIREKLGEDFGPYSSLWVKMWGKYRLEYIIDNLLSGLSEEELEQLIQPIDHTIVID
ncbi:hypothetical protein MTo_00642 [Microcystis aeruginosa NIES-1211]|jgi:hypothetical protein|uniref:Nif11 domain-containing protein n=1 Tax=Microcystis aeruginosa NIES-2519 TaxID=2303981 RepID=A0A5A5RCY5_MICAE|nr:MULTISPECIES: Nif11 family protein [Microcystis]CCI30819.1 conserved hypothetical protein [Microcystis sp. T1-4]GBL13352.1 hypothetical protein MTo_00642 [Microcystis aeruginosa NIES-1211]GCA71021.1 hypothetical protein MiYa_02558 [Microcystis aeruginosa NIES-2519]GCA84811.1 hypothetical protein MiHa_02786 [Microcystis aeruginosa NIES-2522]GCA89272.1 hypothetical protein MiTa_02622 [Microcystis aeruginosa NIES-4264]